MVRLLRGTGEHPMTRERFRLALLRIVKPIVIEGVIASAPEKKGAEIQGLADKMANLIARRIANEFAGKLK